MQDVTERFGQTLNVSSTYQNVHISICLGAFVSYSCKSTSIISAQNVLREIECTAGHIMDHHILTKMRVARQVSSMQW
jgi:hypothetical protein